MNEHLADPAFAFRSKSLRLPDPVGAKRLKTLRRLRASDREWSDADAQFGALYRMGYIRREGDKAQITNAGLSVLERAERITHATKSTMTPAVGTSSAEGTTESESAAVDFSVGLEAGLK